MEDKGEMRRMEGKEGNGIRVEDPGDVREKEEKEEVDGK
jgi:hypothetical protein